MRILLLDIGNTNTHLGLAVGQHVTRQSNFPTAYWFQGRAQSELNRFAGTAALDGAAFCSVVPRARRHVRRSLSRLWNVPTLELSCRNVRGLGIDYPKPKTIGADRLANAMAARHHFGAPVVVVDFGTAVTFDVVNREGDYVGGIIAPGLAAMTDYLHEKTALLPRIVIRETARIVGKSTQQAMLIGAVHGYRGLIKQLVMELKKTLGARRLPVIATGGYARLIAAKVREITAVEPLLTLEGLRLLWQAHNRVEPPRRPA